MARALKLKFVGVVERHHDALGALSSAGDFACVTRGRPRAVVMMCPDGCGEVLTVNLDARSGKAWRADMRRDELSLYPSVWRDDGCGAHFVVWSNNVYWCDVGFRRPEIRSSVVSSVGHVLRAADFRSYVDIAADADVHPWEALWACQLLVERGLAEGQEHSTFAAVSKTPFEPTSTSSSMRKRKRWRWKFW
jgi:hypothetical protein